MTEPAIYVGWPLNKKASMKEDVQSGEDHESYDIRKDEAST